MVHRGGHPVPCADGAGRLPWKHACTRPLWPSAFMAYHYRRALVRVLWRIVAMVWPGLARMSPCLPAGTGRARRGGWNTAGGWRCLGRASNDALPVWTFPVLASWWRAGWRSGGLARYWPAGARLVGLGAPVSAWPPPSCPLRLAVLSGVCGPRWRAVDDLTGLTGARWPAGAWHGVRRDGSRYDDHVQPVAGAALA